MLLCEAEYGYGLVKPDATIYLPFREYPATGIDWEIHRINVCTCIARTVSLSADCNSVSGHLLLVREVLTSLLIASS